jgi:hypothetical protein
MYPGKIDRRDFAITVGIGFGASVLSGCDGSHGPDDNSLKRQFEEKAMQNRGRRVGHHMFSRYPMPKDPEAFDRHYLPHHVQLAKPTRMCFPSFSVMVSRL